MLSRRRTSHKHIHTDTHTKGGGALHMQESIFPDTAFCHPPSEAVPEPGVAHVLSTHPLPSEGPC